MWEESRKIDVNCNFRSPLPCMWRKMDSLSLSEKEEEERLVIPDQVSKV